MKSVAIYGFAPQTRDYVHQSEADEIWTLNNFYNYDVPIDRVTRTFEMHALWMHYSNVEKEPQNHYWGWLREEHPFRIYMPKVREDFVKDFYRIKDVYTNGIDKLTDTEVISLTEELREVAIGIKFFEDNNSSIVRYPLEDIIDDTIPILDSINTDIFPARGMNPYYISSIDYMSALAIYERFDRIEYYGVELREKTEWAMQKSGATFWAGFARGRGIEVLTPKNSVLISAPLYGLSGGDQLIPIQVPEHLKKELTVEFDKQRNIHNHMTGQFSAIKDKYDEAMAEDKPELAEALNEKMKELRIAIENAWRTMYMAEGGLNVVNYLIDHENMQLRPMTLESITRLEEVIINGEKGDYVEK